MLLALAVAAAVQLSPCTIPEVEGEARCGTITVRENRAKKSGRTIDLNVVVLKAKGTAKSDPLFALQGGPGQAVVPLADFYARTFAGIRADRDIVLVDQRGTGKSNPLSCDFGDGLTDLFPPRHVEACRDELSKRADLTQYTTAHAVEDLEEVRKALGYGKVNLYGTSYGTRVAVEYVRRHPKNVRSMIVKGVVPPAMRQTIDTALDTEASWKRVVALGGPSLQQDLEKAMAALPAGITRDAVAVSMRSSLQSAPAMKRFVDAIRAAAKGDRAPLAKYITDQRAAFPKVLSFGMYFSVTCAEDIPRVPDAEAARATANTIARDYWHRQLARACELWPDVPVAKHIGQPLRSNVPVLIVSGGYDPVTPPRMGEALAKTLPNSRHVVVDNGSHSFAGMDGCVDVFMSAFVVDPDPRKVDATCVEKIGPPKLD